MNTGDNSELCGALSCPVPILLSQAPESPWKPTALKLQRTAASRLWDGAEEA